MKKYFFRLIYLKYTGRLTAFRTWFYANLFDSFGAKSYITGRIRVYSPENISIRENCSINEGCVLNGRGSLEIGDFVHLSPYVIINTGGVRL